MFRSMTGYGRSEIKDLIHGEFFVEVQGVNRKYSDVNINLPKNLLALEPKIKDVIAQFVTRGRINVFVGQTKTKGKQAAKINTKAVKEYYEVLKKLQRDLKIKGEIDLLTLMSGVREYILTGEEETDPIKIYPLVERALKGALKNYQSMREKEGHNLAKLIEGILRGIEGRISVIEKAVPKIIKNFKNRIEERMKEISISVSSADDRIQKEISMLSERVDISEELGRMGSHISQFRVLMKKDEPVGKTLDFLIQEMMREVNTMGSKALHTDVSSNTIFIKSDLEKIREQIQNIE